MTLDHNRYCLHLNWRRLVDSNSPEIVHKRGGEIKISERDERIDDVLAPCIDTVQSTELENLKTPIALIDCSKSPSVYDSCPRSLQQWSDYLSSERL